MNDYFINLYLIFLISLVPSILGQTWKWSGSGCGSNCWVACPPFCASCTSNLICTSCIAGYGLYPQNAYGTQNRNCVKCPIGFYLSTSTQHCEYCTTGCAYCTGPSDCTGCQSGYKFLSGVCHATCPDGYFPSAGYCVECPAPCNKCTTASVCTECAAGYGLRNNQCLDCPTGTYLNAGICVVCPNNCATCTSGTTCQSCTAGAYLYNSACPTSCPPGYYGTETFCMKCSDACATCTGISTCQTCQLGWGLLNGACNNCPDGYYLSGTTCQVCSSNCAICSSSSTCEKCQSGFALEGTNCVTCPQGKFAAVGICVDCPATCVECTDASTCQVCVEGYGMTKGQCADCPSTMYYLNGICVANNLTSQAMSNTTTRITTIATSVISGVSVGSSNPLTFGLISKTIEKIRFLQIGYPVELEDVFLSWNVDLYSIGIPDKIAEQLIAKDTPEIFSIYGIDSTFLMNYWGDIMTIGISLLLIVFFRILSVLFPKKPTKETFFDIWLLKLTQMAQNFLVVTVYGGFGDITFYFILEIKTLKFESTASAVSFIASIIFLVIVTVLLSFQIWILISYQKKKKESEEALRRFCTKYSAWGVLFLEFKDSTTLSQAYMTVLILRDIIMSIISITMTSSPYAQAIMFFSISVLMVLYLIFKNPFEGYYERLVQYIMEALVLTVNICVLVLAHMDQKEVGETATRERLGKAIITSNFILNIVAVFCLAIQLVQISYAIYKVIQVIIQHFRKSKNASSDENAVQNLNTALNEVLHQMRRPLAVRRSRILRNPSFETSEELSLDHSPQANRRTNIQTAQRNQRSQRNQKKNLMLLYKHNKEFKKAIEDIRLGGQWR